jgi:hypothetical protein
MKKLKNDDVEWVVNEMGELGVKIKDQFFFMYKGESYSGGTKWRHVFKREFGETCYAWDIKKLPDSFSYTIDPRVSNYICHLGEDVSEWKDIK